MKIDDVPQDHTSGLGGHKKPIYVINAQGEYTTRLSSGWDAEEVVLQQAIHQYSDQAASVLQKARRGEASPLEFYMYLHRMDPGLLAQGAGFFRWQVKRHLKVAVFNKLPPKKLQRYADVFGLSLDQLKTLPDDNEANCARR